MSVARSEPLASRRRRSTSSSGTSTPEAASLSRSPSSTCQTVVTAGRSGRTSSKRAKCSAVSTIIAVAPESLRFHATCVGDDVS